MRKSFKLAAAALMALTIGGSAGCMYGGIATATDGSVYVARNDMILFGLLRKVYVCRPTGAVLACTETTAP
ncbi:MAG TPA: hypothetical protein VGG33_02840 [Polyangia bacterium]